MNNEYNPTNTFATQKEPSVHSKRIRSILIHLDNSKVILNGYMIDSFKEEYPSIHLGWTNINPHQVD